jgi:two-component system CheB/CheR fusion protein
MLTEILSRATLMPVVEVTDHMPVEANRVFVIPPGMTMGIGGGVLRLSPRTDPKSPHHSIDQFLRSLADDQGHRAIGVILSGSATDGTVGLEAIKAEGGITFAQDDTAQHRSMPRNAVAAGCVDFVLAPAEIAQEINGHDLNEVLIAFDKAKHIKEKMADLLHEQEHQPDSDRDEDSLASSKQHPDRQPWHDTQPTRARHRGGVERTLIGMVEEPTPSRRQQEQAQEREADGEDKRN